MFTDESPATTAAFLHRAWRFYAGHGITIERVLTDNGGCYRSRDFAAACDELGIGHRWTRPYRPQTNGKAERLVRTCSASGPTPDRSPTPRIGSPCCPSSSTSAARPSTTWL